MLLGLKNSESFSFNGIENNDFRTFFAVMNFKTVAFFVEYGNYDRSYFSVNIV